MENNIKNRIKTMQDNERHREEILKEKTEAIIAKYGTNILENYFLPNNFKMQDIKDKDAMQTRIQQDCLPFTNEQIQEMIDMPKYPINDVYIDNDKGKVVNGKFLIGEHNGKKALFVIFVEKSKAYGDDFDKFSIKLNLYAGGKTWFEIVRIDSQEAEHPNLIKNGKVVSNSSQVEWINTPHVHRTTQESQLFSDTLDYSTARSTVEYLNLKTIDNNTLFRAHVELFLEKTNIIGKDMEKREEQIKNIINEDLPENWHFATNNSLFTYSSQEVDVINNDGNYFGE